MDTTARMAGGYKEKQLQTDWKECFGEGRTDKVCGRKFIVQPVMDKQLIWRGKGKNTFQKITELLEKNSWILSSMYLRDN